MKFQDDDIKQLFSKVKDDSVFRHDFDSGKSWKKVAQDCGFPEDTSGLTHTWRDWLEFYIWDFSHVMVKPMAAMAVFVFLFVGGWIGVVNASISSLPGDNLYSVKLKMEKVQLALATSGSQRAQLKTEFTSRRLEEMVALAASSNQLDVSVLAMAVDRVKQDVTDIKDELSTDQSSSVQITELAKAVGRKADVYTSTVTSSTPSLSKDVQQKVKEVKEMITETKNQAVEVMVTAHEQVQTTDNTHELKLTFEKAFTHAQEIATKDESPKLLQATALQKQGAYRRAFQVLKEIEQAHVLPTE